ncbi:DMT family transporter [Mumia sp. zg.B21]|uniref:DMT family transporter n=1 Tax=Mumia sp. zg.B21 TaxID=2855447 RepID=UPI001C6DD861|nr:DMT family transporter [Mumia sp. zg.B21]MBW9211017.1 DMT family transporter [Mumia sp. zg.B21]
MSVVIVVLVAALLHATWSALAKSTSDRVAGFAAMSTVSVVLGAVGVAVVPSPDPSSYPYLAISGVLHVVYMLLMTWSYRVGDFNQVYPLARGTSPLLVTVFGLLFLHEVPGRGQLLGILLVCAGLLALVFTRSRRPAPAWPAVASAVATGVAITSYTVVDGLGVRRADAVLGYVFWLQLIMGLGFLVVAATVRGRRVLSFDRTIWIRGLGGGLIATVGYGLVLWAQTQADLGTVAALRETSIVFGAVIGAALLHEPMGRQRVVASAVVVAGVVLIV